MVGFPNVTSFWRKWNIQFGNFKSYTGSNMNDSGMGGLEKSSVILGAGNFFVKSWQQIQSIH